MTSDAGFEASGAAGRAQALTDRNDPSAAQVTTRAEVFDINFQFLSLLQLRTLHMVVVSDGP
jgi:hypothetical protein